MPDGTRKMVKSVLHKYALGADDGFGDLGYPGLDYDALASQAIAIECEVEHINTSPGEPLTKVKMGLILGHHGTPGEALAIILPLPKEGKDALYR